MSSTLDMMSTSVYIALMSNILDNSSKRLARTAGVLYLLLVVFGAFAHLYARSSVHVPEDAAATAANIVANATLFRLGLVADILMATTFVFLAIALYRLLAHLNREVAVAMGVFAAVGAGMILVNLLFHFAALLVATEPSYLLAFGTEGSDALTLLLLDMHSHGYTLAGVFFGLWLLPLGYLVYQSSIFPRALGVLLMIACFTYILGTVSAFLLPDLSWAHQALEVPNAVAEFWLVGYLLVMGVRAPRREDRIGVAA